LADIELNGKRKKVSLYKTGILFLENNRI